ncbi:hypothetical protein NtB2_00096 [Lactococcus termiticola]|uniref:DUF5648 domain-containing protein n=2 Tax=Lactococcus termiticola TaxID=2169526 RepID=A0A2R5HD41_9LACT|nr:hypothetical protein NtB2_00096 [Lactococcus termiticola]
MRTRKSQLTFIISGLALVLGMSYATAHVSHADSFTTVKIYRLYNKKNNEHIFTKDQYEYKNLPKLSKDWKQEGEAWTAPTKSTEAIYRIYNPKSGEHVYTSGSNEIKVLTKQKWKNEGIAFYSAASDEYPVYRMFNPDAGVGAHFETLSKNERDTLVATGGWTYEGVAWYAVNPALHNSPAIKGEEAASMEGDVRLNGSGTGYHAKFTLNGSGEQAVSFGIQYDSYSNLSGGIYRKKAVFMSEDIDGSSHIYRGYKLAALNQWFHIKIAYYPVSDAVAFYVDGQLISTAAAPFRGHYVVPEDGTEKGNYFLIGNVGGSARVRNDVVNAEFKDVVTTTKGMTAWDDTSNDWVGLDAKWDGVLSPAAITISGKSTLPTGLNWDTYAQAGLPTADGVAQVSLKLDQDLLEK